MELSERLHQLRKEADFSQEYVAEKLEVSRQALSKWENGQANPDINNIKKLSELYGKSTDYILFGEERNPQIVYKEKIIYKEKRGFEKLNSLPRSLRIAFSICIVAITVGVIVPVLFLLFLMVGY